MLICFICVFRSLFYLCLLFLPHPLYLHLLCLNELSALSVFFIVGSVYVRCLCLICSVYICYALVNYLLRLHLLSLALFISTIYILSTPSTFAVPIAHFIYICSLYFVYSVFVCYVSINCLFVCVFRGLFYLRLLSVSCLSHLHLLFMSCPFCLHPQFHYFYCKLYKIIISYYIGHRKADDFRISASSMTHLLSVPYLLRLCLPFSIRLRLLWIALSASAIYALSSPFISSVLSFPL